MTFNPKEQVFGRDYSFDEEEDIKPSKIYKGLDIGVESEDAIKTDRYNGKKDARQYNRSYITPREDNEGYRAPR